MLADGAFTQSLKRYAWFQRNTLLPCDDFFVFSDRNEEMFTCSKTWQENLDFEPVPSNLARMFPAMKQAGSKGMLGRPVTCMAASNK